MLLVGIQRHTQFGQGARDESLHVVFAAEHSRGLAPLGQHVVGFQAALRKDGAVLGSLFASALPDGLDFFGGLTKVQLRLAAHHVVLAQQH